MQVRLRKKLRWEAFKRDTRGSIVGSMGRILEVRSYEATTSLQRPPYKCSLEFLVKYCFKNSKLASFLRSSQPYTTLFEALNLSKVFCSLFPIRTIIKIGNLWVTPIGQKYTTSSIYAQISNHVAMLFKVFCGSWFQVIKRDSVSNCQCACRKNQESKRRVEYTRTKTGSELRDKNKRFLSVAAIIFLLSFWVYILIFVFRWPPPLSDHFPLH